MSLIDDPELAEFAANYPEIYHRLVELARGCAVDGFAGVAAYSAALRPVFHNSSPQISLHDSVILASAIWVREVLNHPPARNKSLLS